MLRGVEAKLAERLMRYAAVDTQSDETSDTQPSTAIQWDLAQMLEAELQEIGAQDVEVTSYGAVLATVPGTDADAPTIGFCAHMDTAPQFHAAGVKPPIMAVWEEFVQQEIQPLQEDEDEYEWW